MLLCFHTMQLRLQGTSAYKIVPGYLLQLPFVVDNGVAPYHRRCIADAAAYFNEHQPIHGMHVQLLDRCTGPGAGRGCHTISYIPEERAAAPLGYTEYTGTYGGGNWTIFITDIFLDRWVPYENVCFNIMLHEIVHAKGLDHNGIPGTVMGNTVQLDKYHRPLPAARWSLSVDDILGLLESAQRVV